MQFWQHTLRAPNGSDYLLRLWSPQDPAPAEGYPLLLLLDGDWIHDHVRLFLARQPRHINYAIATLGFGLERPAARQRRSYDYTPLPPPPHEAVDPREPNWPCGGAVDLMAFIQQQVLPTIQQQLSIDPTRLGLYGHSYGGLFVLYSLLTQPHLFKHYISASPSLWWYAPFMQNLAAQLPELTRRIQLSVLIGGKEQWRPKPADPQAPRPEGIPTLRFLEPFLTQLPQRSQLKQQLHIYPEAEHGAMLGLSTEFALLEFMA